MKKDTLKFYNSIYNPLFEKKYTKGTHRGGVSLQVFEKFSKINGIKVKKVIDVGCAWGKTLRYWNDKGIKSVGVDVSDISVKFCKRKGFKSYLSSATDLSLFEDKKFDLYMASDVYEHLKIDDLSYAIEEAKRVTKKYLLIRPHPVLDKRGRSDIKKALHLTVWDLNKWEEFFNSYDLKIIKVGNNGEVTYKNVFLMEIKGE
jgi:cyclopropane fatty-acyl-phospholipid synthase-like methyltransferase